MLTEYKVKRIEEDMDYGCEERGSNSPVMAVVTLTDASGREFKIRQIDKMLYEKDINEGDRVTMDHNNELWKTET